MSKEVPRPDNRPLRGFPYCPYAFAIQRVERRRESSEIRKVVYVAKRTSKDLGHKKERRNIRG